ncbi:MAG: GNAT family N-acetyltransferase [Crocinitomicaceae bacterium]|nr:GNAT family N-acetyltransferase [Crocinitomicaceae bacterium]
MEIQIKHYSQLNIDELYSILQLRCAVFVVEQDCPYLDLDNLDQDAYHLMAKQDQKLLGVVRILKPGIVYQEPAIGRVASREDSRHLKLGHLMVKAANDYCDETWPEQGIRLSAQSHLMGFYEKHGYVSTGKSYLEDGIPHDEMLKSPENQ